MKTELQMDIVHMVCSILLAIISKVMENIIGVSSLFAMINLISLLLFVKAVIKFFEHKYDMKVLKFTTKRIISER